MLNLTSTQLRQAADLKEKIAALETELNYLIGDQAAAPVQALASRVAPRPPVPAEPASPGKRKFSAAHIAKIRAAQKARWAKARGDKVKPAPQSAPVAAVKPGGMSAAGRARIAAAQKLRWAKVNAAKPAATPAKAEVKPGKTRKMSAAGRAAIAAAARTRWAKFRGAKRA